MLVLSGGGGEVMLTPSGLFNLQVSIDPLWFSQKCSADPLWFHHKSSHARGLSIVIVLTLATCEVSSEVVVRLSVPFYVRVGLAIKVL